MTRYRKPPLEVEAVQWTGENQEEVEALIGFPMARLFPGIQAGYWIVRQPGGSIHAHRESVFEATYEPAGHPAQGVEGAYTREQLLSDKAVERVARENWMRERVRARLADLPPWEMLAPEQAQQKLHEARQDLEAALEALDKGKGGDDA